MFTISLTNQQALTTFLQQLVQTASFSGMEGNVAQLLTDEMHKVGFSHVTIDNMGNVIGQLGNGKPPHLLYYTHLDTTGIGDITAWQHDPFAAVIDDGTLYGRGSVEPKGSLASMVYGAKLLAEHVSSLNGTLYLAGSVHGESAEGVAIEYLLENAPIQPDWVVIGAPSGLQINLGQRGRIELLVNVQGRACNAATPALGTNAIYGAARIIFSLELMAGSLANDDFLGPGTLAVTHIDNIERTKNVIPDRCTFVIDRRLTTGETEAHTLAEVQGIMAKEGVVGTVQVNNHKIISYTGKIRTEKISYPAWITEEKEPLVKTASRVVQTITGSKPRLGCWNFSTAGIYTMGSAGIPTIGFGPGDERFAHTANERIALKDCFTAARVYAQLAEDLLK